MKAPTELTAVFLVLALIALGCSRFGQGDPEVTNSSAGNSSSAPSGTPAASSGELRNEPPEPLIAELYKQHDADKGPFRERSRSVVEKYFAKPIADLILKDKQTPAGEMGALDFDPLYDAQDIDIKKFSVGPSDIKDEKATVTVSFENFSEKKSIVYTLVRERDAWKISDIKYPEGFTLLEIYRENSKPEKPAEPTASREFEGRYRVGDTTCIVKPVKMAFEVRWAKGSGSEYFFAKDSNVFESEEGKGGRNEFRFDDENYNSGTFVRADGKSFSVSRIK